MKVTIIANLSANGQLLLAENPAHAAPQEALAFFLQQANIKGNLIIGRKTFDVLQQFPGGVKAFFPNVEIVLLSRSNLNIEGYIVSDSPEHAVKYLTEKGFEEIIIGGGTNVYNEFLEKNLVTDIYFNYLPMIIGDGGVIGRSENLNIKFNIIEQKLLTDNIAQVHFQRNDGFNEHD